MITPVTMLNPDYVKEQLNLPQLNYVLQELFRT